MLAYAPLALFVMCFAELNLIQAIVFACIYTRLANHSSSVASGNSSSTTSTSSAGASLQICDVLITPSGVGVIAFPLTIVLSLGPPKTSLCQRCDA